MRVMYDCSKCGHKWDRLESAGLFETFKERVNNCPECHHIEPHELQRRILRLELRQKRTELWLGWLLMTLHGLIGSEAFLKFKNDKMPPGAEELEQEWPNVE